MSVPTSPTDKQELARRNRRAFLSLGAGLTAAWGAWTLARHSPDADGLPVAFRTVLGWNERLASELLYSPSHLAPVFPPEAAQNLRANGDIGLGDDRGNENWTVALSNSVDGPSTSVPLNNIKALPRSHQVTEFKCIEGWSTVAAWTGVRFQDFVQRFSPDAPKTRRWVSLETPDSEYYVGLDMASALHPQTMLALQLNGADLTDDHGAPIRLVIPVKYGTKNIKRISKITFTSERPDDYWAEQGYDYYSGL